MHLDSSAMPVPEKSVLKVGFMRLTDAAPLIAAQELGLYTRYGLQVSLLREVSWATLRDRLAIGELDAAQLLAPMPLAASLGIGGFRCEMRTGLNLSLNGNGICVSSALFEALSADLDEQWLHDPLAVARAVARRVRWRRERGLRLLNFATVYPFSMQTLLLRHWLQAAGIDPETEVRLAVLPPEQMTDHLRSGLIDGFCAGAPWPASAIGQCGAVLLTTGYHIWNNAPEKVLAVTREWDQAYPGTHLRLRLALMEAAAWLDCPTNRAQAITWLGGSGYLDLPEEVLRPAMLGQIHAASWTKPVDVPDYHVFSRYGCGYPWHAHAVWYLRNLGQFLRRPIEPAEAEQSARQVYQPALYRQACQFLGWPSPDGDERPGEGQAAEPVRVGGIEYGAFKRL